jgi:hypothetical protein
MSEILDRFMEPLPLQFGFRLRKHLFVELLVRRHHGGVCDDNTAGFSILDQCNFGLKASRCLKENEKDERDERK